jgi:hypothetical protein
MRLDFALLIKAVPGIQRGNGDAGPLPAFSVAGRLVTANQLCAAATLLASKRKTT